MIRGKIDNPKKIILETKIKVPRRDWDAGKEEGILNIYSIQEWKAIFNNLTIKAEVDKFYEVILNIHEILRSRKYLDADLIVDTGKNPNRPTIMLNVLSEILTRFVHESKEMNTQISKNFLAFARQKYRERLDLLQKLSLDNYLISILSVSPALVDELRIDTEEFLSYYTKIHAGAKKATKLFCIYPIFIILRLDGLGETERTRYMRELLIDAKAMKFGRNHWVDDDEDSKVEELQRIREWDRESLKWFNTL